jgi:hypothetical protein
MKNNKDIFFETKEESNARRMNEALERSPHERFMFFLRLCQKMQFFQVKRPHPNESNI